MINILHGLKGTFKSKLKKKNNNSTGKLQRVAINFKKNYLTKITKCTIYCFLSPPRGRAEHFYSHNNLQMRITVYFVNLLTWWCNNRFWGLFSPPSLFLSVFFCISKFWIRNLSSWVRGGRLSLPYPASCCRPGQWLTQVSGCGLFILRNVPVGRDVGE